jgi:dTDP-glucose pyrophosphorylase
MEYNLEEIKKLTIDVSATLIAAMKQMDENDCKSLIVTKEGAYFALISIGDIQRQILSKGNLDYVVKDVLRTNITVGTTEDSPEEIRVMMEERRIEVLPILDAEKKLVDVIFWRDRYDSRQKKRKNIDNIPVVIMAGGKGTRLKPITDVIPKPLVPLGGKPIVETIIDSFCEEGCTNFYLSVNYKADFIKFHFDSVENKEYNVHYFKEESPMGTAGSLRLLKDIIKTTFFVSNCDILIDQDYHNILKYHRDNKNELTAVAAIKEYNIPYGTMELSENGLLTNLTEKPNLTYYVNAGVYILEPHLIAEIPEGEGLYHITHLMESILARNGKVGVFPVSEGAWFDIGNWKEYDKSLLNYKQRFG